MPKIVYAVGFPFAPCLRLTLSRACWLSTIGGRCGSSLSATVVRSSSCSRTVGRHITCASGFSSLAPRVFYRLGRVFSTLSTFVHRACMFGLRDFYLWRFFLSGFGPWRWSSFAAFAGKEPGGAEASHCPRGWGELCEGSQKAERWWRWRRSPILSHGV